MNAHTKADELATSTALVDLGSASGGQVATFQADERAVLTDPKRFEQFFEQVKAETDKLEVDLTTEKGRKAIASMAYKVARTKTALDEFGKKLNEDARKQISAVDEARRRVRERLDALRDQVRQPLTDWEEAEERRKARCAEVMERLSAAVVVTIEDTSGTVSARLAEVEGLELNEAVFQDSLSMAQGMRANAVDLLTAAVARLQKEEADRAELERLRAAEAERQRQEQERIEHEAAEARRREEEAAEARRREEAAAAEAARLEEARTQAATEERRKAEEAAATERRQQEAAHAAEVARLQRERDELAAQQAAEARRKDEEAEAERKRAADREHQSTVMGEAKVALMDSCKLSEDVARQVVLAIRGGAIPHVALKF
jgi:colicin import membrane protein